MNHIKKQHSWLAGIRRTRSASFRVNMDGDYSSTILVSYTKRSPDGDRILEDDYVTMYGWWIGTYTDETVLGASVTVPLFYCEYLDIE